MDDTWSSVTWDQVTLTNANQLRKYIMVVPKAGDRISLVTNKYDGGNIIITAPHMSNSILISKVIKDFEWGAYGQGI